MIKKQLIKLIIIFGTLFYSIPFFIKNRYYLLLLQKTSVKTKKTYYHVNNMKMEGNKKLKEIDIKNCTCYYFDEIINIHDLNLDNMLLDEKSYENFLICDAA